MSSNLFFFNYLPHPTGKKEVCGAEPPVNLYQKNNKECIKNVYRDSEKTGFNLLLSKYIVSFFSLHKDKSMPGKNCVMFSLCY